MCVCVCVTVCVFVCVCAHARMCVTVFVSACERGYRDGHTIRVTASQRKAEG